MCGEVNSKNRLGGFAGFVRFSYSVGGGPSAVVIAGKPDDNEIINTFCAK